MTEIHFRHSKDETNEGGTNTNTNDTSDLKSASFEVFSSSPPPTIGSLDIDDESVEIGSDITLTANDVGDVDGIVEEVRFYRDSNHNNTLEVGTDQLIGTSSQGTELVCYNA